jgi:hypothetical protein
MKLPRFGLRTFLIAFVVLGLLFGWVSYQLNWIHQRHKFLMEHMPANLFRVAFGPKATCPWSLRIFGEQAQKFMVVPKEDVDEGRRLFPEADVLDPSKEKHTAN